MKFAVRVPANILYPAITSPWEAELSPEDSLRFARKVANLGDECLEWVEWFSREMIPAYKE
jgi:hypothetical protein